MISSVIAKLNCDTKECMQLTEKLSAHPALEVGEIVGGHSLPITIDTSGNQETEAITRWMLQQDGISFVDVVFVHFEEEDERVVIRKQSVPDSCFE